MASTSSYSGSTAHDAVTENLPVRKRAHSEVSDSDLSDAYERVPKRHKADVEANSEPNVGHLDEDAPQDASVSLDPENISIPQIALPDPAPTVDTTDDNESTDAVEEALLAGSEEDIITTAVSHEFSEPSLSSKARSSSPRRPSLPLIRSTMSERSASPEYGPHAPPLPLVIEEVTLSEPAPAISRPLGSQLAEFNCPICFCPPTNATLTPCGHICCGSCLFSAIKIAAGRAYTHDLLARCPVCRATIPKWDGRGGGVIGLKPKVIYRV